MKTKLIITGLAFFAITAAGFSQNSQQQRPMTDKSNCSQFIDENKNGICDKCENQKMGHGKRNRNCCGEEYKGQGQQGQGMRNGQGGKCKNFVDDNKNGICDRKEDFRMGKTEN
jgi:aminoglycoside phosphotransferase